MQHQEQQHTKAPAPAGGNELVKVLAPGHTSPGSSPRRRRHCSPQQPCVVELHQGATRIVHQADGSIVCEPVDVRGRRTPSPSRSAAPTAVHFHDQLRGRLVGYAIDAASVVAGIGAALGFVVSLTRTCDSDFGTVDTMSLVRSVKSSVQNIVIGTMTGAVVAPATIVFGSLVAAAGLVRMAVRPALLGLAVQQGVRWVRRHQLGAAAIIRKLQSGDLVKQLEALRRLVARISASAAFTSQFKRLAGVEVLLNLLERALAAAEAGAAALVGPTASLSARALAELSKQGDVVDALVQLEAIPVLVRAASVGLKGTANPSASPMSASGVLSTRSSGSNGHLTAAEAQQGSAALLVHAMTALSRVTMNHAVAQTLLASEPGVCGLLVSALEAATSRGVRGATPAACDELRAHAIALVQSLALEPAAKAELGAAGGVEALSAALVTAQPWTQGQATAAAALHALVRGEPANQRRLAAVAPAGLSAAINRALVSGATGPVTGAVSPSALSGSSASIGTSQPLSMSLLSAPVPPQDCHMHRADLLALSNVIARYTVPAPSSPVKITAADLVPTNKASAPARAPFLQRFRLRSNRLTAPSETTTKGAASTSSAAPAAATNNADSAAPAVGIPAAAAAVVASPAASDAAEAVSTAAAAGGVPTAVAVVKADEEVMNKLKHVQVPAPGASSSVGGDEDEDGASADQDWEKDMMGSPDKNEAEETLVAAA